VTAAEQYTVRTSEEVQIEILGDALLGVAAGPYPVASAVARGITRLPPGPLGRSLAPLSPVQRAVILAEILGPPLALRPPGSELGPVRRAR
jgi:hypothetical protein